MLRRVLGSLVTAVLLLVLAVQEHGSTEGRRATQTSTFCEFFAWWPGCW